MRDNATLRTQDLVTALRLRFPSDAYALCLEVGNATGFETNRHADAIAMSLWPSRGLSLHGFELKASRSDWLRELRRPEKAEAIARYCHYWWLVVVDDKIIAKGELPETWGLLTLTDKGKLKSVREAPKQKPADITPSFLAALLRSAAKPAVSLDKEALSKEYTRGFNDAHKTSERQVEQLIKKCEAIQQDIREFEAASGVSLRGYSGWDRHTPNQIGRIVRDVLNGVHDRDFYEVQEIRRLAAAIVARIDTSNVRPPDQADDGEVA